MSQSLGRAAPTRQSVIPTTLDSALITDNEFLFANSGIVTLIETGGVTSNAYTYDSAITPTTAPATTIADYASTLGHLLDVFAASNAAGIEVRIDFGVASGSSTVYWRVLTVALTPGIPSPINAFRLNTHYCRVTLFNTDLGAPAAVDYSINVRSL